MTSFTGEQLRSFVDSEEEVTVLEFRPSYRKYLVGSGAGLWSLIFVIVLLPFTFGASLLILVFSYVSNRFKNYTLTNQRIRIREGILIRREDDLELYRVKDVKSRVSLWNRTVKIGCIDIISSEITDTKRQSNLSLDYIDNPTELRETLRVLSESIRRKRNVREIDIF